MPDQQNPLKKMATLACLDWESDPAIADQLSKDVAAIMDYVKQLAKISTTDVVPLCHPLDIHQPLRKDEANEENCLAQLAEIAPFFTDNLFMVPKVIDMDK